MPLFMFVSLYEFRQFLSIVLWIAVPATLIAILITVFLHYRRRKHQLAPEAALEEGNNWQTLITEPSENLPDWLASADPDNATLLKKYEREVRRYRENYATLEQEFKELEDKYTDLRNKAYNTNKEEDATHPSMQATIQQLQEDLRLQQEEKEQHAAEILNLEQLLKSMEQSVSAAREEATQLQQYHLRQIEELGKGANAGDQAQGLQQLLAQAETEKQALKEKLYEQEYLPDVLEEKKLQIDFLQTQLEQRIKNYHLLEQQATQATEQLQLVQTAVAAKTGHIEQLELQVQELQQQQGLQQSEIADHQDTVRTLHERLAGEQQKAASLEAHLEQSHQLFNRIYSDLAQSQVIIHTAEMAAENA
jgi:chromosome segregation ATPase